MQSKEARLILGAAIVDDILAIAALSVVITMVQTGNVAPDIISITLLILKILGLFAALLIGAVLIVPRILHVEKLWKSKGSIEGITTAAFFGAAGMAAFMNLSPIVGAFAVGMAVSSTKIIKRVEEYVEKLQIIFAPLFFAIIGAQVDLRGVNFNVLLLSGVIVSIAIVKVNWLWSSFNDISKKQDQINESRNWNDFKRRSRLNCSRSRSDIRSLICRYLYCRNYNGSSNYNHYSYVA
jgi:Kef-type K+ transport system membrane component KefB